MWKVRAFLAVAETLSFTRAARRLKVTQPAISRGIRDLERSLSTPLFDRSRRRVALTESGRIFLRYARALLDACKDAEIAVASAGTEVAGSLTLGIGRLWEDVVPQCLGPFHKRYPKVTFAVVSGTTNDIIILLAQGEISLGFVSRDPGRRVLELLPMCEHEYLVIARPNHPLSRRGLVSPAMLNGESFVRVAESITNPGPNQPLDYLEQFGLKPKHVFSVGSAESLKGAVHSGLGLAYVSELTVRSDLRHGFLSQVRIDVPPLRRTVYAVRNRSRFFSPTQRTFLNYVKGRIARIR